MQIVLPIETALCIFMVTTGSGWVNPWLQIDFGKAFLLSFHQLLMDDLEKVKQNSGLSHAAPKNSRDRGDNWDIKDSVFGYCFAEHPKK